MNAPDWTLNKSVFIALGSNINKEENLVKAIRALSEVCKVERASSLYETKAVGMISETFYNAAILITTSLSAKQLKWDILRPMEARFGRVRNMPKFSPRPLDLDIVLYDTEILTLDDKEIPDSDIVLYAHISHPLAEIAPDFCHPITRQTLAQIAQESPNSKEIIGIYHYPRE